MLSFPYKILASDCDGEQKLKISSLMKMLEEISIADTTRLHMGRDKTLDKGFLWVISRLSISIRHLPSYDQVIKLITCPEKRERCLFPRYYVIKDAAGQTLLEAEALWALIDLATRRPVDPVKNKIRIPSFPFKKETEAIFGVEAFKEEAQEEKTVAPSDLDLNGHMTNFRYGDWVYDLHSSNFHREHPLTALRFVFLHEAKEGEKLLLSIGRREQKESVIGSSSQGLVFQVQAEYK